VKKLSLLGGIALLGSVVVGGLTAQPAQAGGCPAWGPFVGAGAQQGGLGFISQSAQLYPGRIAERIGQDVGCD
jgi:hypothetical protein